MTHDIDEALFLADRLIVKTPRPSRILDDIPLDFRRPRERGLITDPRFTASKQRCLTLLRSIGCRRTERSLLPPPTVTIDRLGRS